jgi:hypothetical protein
MAEASNSPTSVCKNVVREEVVSSETNPKITLVIALNGVAKVEANNPTLWKALKEQATVIFTQDCHFIEIYLKDKQFTTNLSAIILADSALYSNIKYSGDRSSIMSTITSYLKTGGTVVMCSLFAKDLHENKARFEAFSQKLGLEWKFSQLLNYFNLGMKKIQQKICNVPMNGQCREHGMFRTTAQTIFYISSTTIANILVPFDGSVFKFIKNNDYSDSDSVAISLVSYQRGWLGYVGCYELDNADITRVILDMCGLNLKPCKIFNKIR